MSEEENIVEEINYVEEGIFFASINRGFFILPDYLEIGVPDTIRKIPLSDSHCQISLNLIWKKNNSNDALQGFVNEFRDFTRNHTPIS